MAQDETKVLTSLRSFRFLRGLSGLASRALANTSHHMAGGRSHQVDTSRSIMTTLKRYAEKTVYIYDLVFVRLVARQHLQLVLESVGKFRRQLLHPSVARYICRFMQLHHTFLLALKAHMCPLPLHDSQCPRTTKITCRSFAFFEAPRAIILSSQNANKVSYNSI